MWNFMLSLTDSYAIATIFHFSNYEALKSHLLMFVCFISVYWLHHYVTNLLCIMHGLWLLVNQMAK